MDRRRRQRGVDLGGQVGVVVDERDAVDLTAEHEATGHATETGQRLRRSGGIAPERGIGLTAGIALVAASP